MKRFVRILAVLTLVLTTVTFFGQQPVSAEYINPADAKLTTEFGQKIDLNNSDIRDFRDLPRFYPTLAGKIISNAPYGSVEDVLDIPGLNSVQKSLLQDNLTAFTATPVDITFVAGQDRFNAGIY